MTERARRPRRRCLEWKAQVADAKDLGVQYQLHSESIRFEGTFWYPHVYRLPWEPFGRGRLALVVDERDVFPRGYRGTKAQAIRLAEVDAAVREDAGWGSK